MFFNHYQSIFYKLWIPQQGDSTVTSNFCKFFWGSTDSLKGKQWVVWNEMCFLKEKEAWVLDLYMMLIMLYLLNYAGGSGYLLLYGVARAINIVKSYTLLW